MLRVVVIVPVLGRPHRAAPVVESLAASVTGPVLAAEVLFVCSPGDDEQIAACHATHASAVVAEWPAGAGDYARKINFGFVRATADPAVDFVLLGADDLVFHPGWLEAAVIVQLRSGACVVGTNDLGNAAVMRGDHATHSLVHRNYTEGIVDDPDPGLLLNPAYDHNFCDNEFVGTALARRTFAMALESHVEHLHPIWRKGEDDDTYRKGQRALSADRVLHDRRAKLWARP